MSSTKQTTKRGATLNAGARGSSGPGIRFWILSAILVGALGLGVWLRTRPAVLPVVAATHFGQLDPYLQAYLRQRWERIRSEPRKAEPRIQLAMTYAVNGLWPEAKQVFEQLAQMIPGNPLPELYLGVADQEMDDATAAREKYRQVTERHPDFAQGWSRRGEAALRAGVLEEAENAFAQVQRLSSNEWRGWAGLGEVRLRQRRSKEALELLRRALTLQPDSRVVHSLLGQALQEEGNLEDAGVHRALGQGARGTPMLDEWSRTATEHVRTAGDLARLADEYADEGRPEKSVELLEGALPYHTKNPSLLNQLAIAYNRAGQPAKAQILVEQLLKLESKHVAGWVTSSYALAQLGRLQEALAASERAISLATNLAQPHIARANALLGMERDEEALSALKAAAALESRNPDIRVEMGDILWKNLERPSQALSNYLEAVTLNPALPAVRIRLADLQIHLGQRDEAQAQIRMLKKLQPQAPELPVLEKKWAASGKGKTP